VNLHSVFLRTQCTLPERFNPLRKPCGDSWMLVDETTAQVFDIMIRRTGWHFMWILGSCSRRGIALAREDAIQRALVRALGGIARRFNAAELESVQVARYPGFHVAKVTLQPRQIQQYTSLEIAVEQHPQAVPAR